LKNLLFWVIRFLIPFVVLYTIGYMAPGFSALTVAWILLLSVLIAVGVRLVDNAFRIKQFGRFQEGVISFLVAAVVIFTVTLGIEGGNVPLGGALLAALIIGVLTTLAPESERKTRREGTGNETYS